jgi:enoyl-CoA hydratase/carnithine racemase
MEQLPIPVVASIRGTVFGGGLEIALACDMIIAAKSTRFGSVEVTIGIAPIMGAVQRLVQRIGVARAKEFAMLGRRHDAETMERIGLINLCVADPDLEEVSLNYAQQLANGPTVAHRAIKQLANLAQARCVEAADQAMEELIAPIFKSEDAKRGVQALGTTGPGSASFEGN